MATPHTLRARVLSTIARALGDARERTCPEPRIFEVSDTEDDAPELARRFARELSDLSGTAQIVRDRAECAHALAAYLHERGVRSVAVQSRQLATDIASRLTGFEVAKAAEREKAELAHFDCGLLEAPSLLADTGSAIVMLDNTGDRVLPYLPRTCAIVSSRAALHSGMSPSAVACIQAAADAGVRGEALIVAGPSRTADIEKTLVLGAHGPQALAVFIIENP